MTPAERAELAEAVARLRRRLDAVELRGQVEMHIAIPDVAMLVALAEIVMAAAPRTTNNHRPPFGDGEQR